MKRYLNVIKSWSHVSVFDIYVLWFYGKKLPSIITLFCQTEKTIIQYYWLFHGPFHYEQLFTHNKQHFPNKRLGIKAHCLLTLNREWRKGGKRKSASNEQQYVSHIEIRTHTALILFRPKKVLLIIKKYCPFQLLEIALQNFHSIWLSMN